MLYGWLTCAPDGGELNQVPWPPLQCCCCLSLFVCPCAPADPEILPACPPPVLFPLHTRSSLSLSLSLSLYLSAAYEYSQASRTLFQRHPRLLLRVAPHASTQCARSSSSPHWQRSSQCPSLRSPVYRPAQVHVSPAILEDVVSSTSHASARIPL